MSNAIVVGGGGIKGIASIGALHFLNLKNVSIFSGTSIGSLICLFLALKFTPWEIYTFILNGYHSTVSNIDVTKLMTSFGLCDISDSLAFFKTIAETKVDVDELTFQKLFDIYGSTLFVTTMNLTKKEPCVFSRFTHPDVVVFEAIKLSCGIPFIFQKQTMFDDVFIDGGYAMNIPIKPVISYFPDIQIHAVFTNNVATGIKSESIFDYVEQIMMLQIRANEIESVKEFIGDSRVSLTKINTSNINRFQIVISTDVMKELFQLGYDSARGLSMEKKLV